MKYIDADLLRKEVKKYEKAANKSALGCADSETRSFYQGKDFAYQYVGILIDALQQEQDFIVINKKDWEAQEQFRKNKVFGKPLQQEQQEVDLEEEITNFIQAHYHTRFDETLENGNDPLTVFDFEDVARHFYELGKNSK